MTDEENEEKLRSFVRAHQVTWETGALTRIRADARIQVGYEVELRASHGASAERPTPGCVQCQRLYLGLKELAEASLPPADRPTRAEIGPFDWSFHLHPGRAFHPEVVLRIQLVHRDEYFKPIDDCERRCLDEIQRNLAAFGAQEGTWRRPPNAGRPGSE